MRSLVRNPIALFLFCAAITFNWCAVDASATPTIDQSFGGGAVTPEPIPGGQWSETVASAAIQQDGSVLAAFELDTDYGHQSELTLMRFLPNGTPDTTFGARGVAWIRLPDAASNEFPQVIRLSDGKSLVAGQLETKEKRWFSYLARVDSDGQLDSGFADGGVRLFSAPSHGYSYPIELAERGDGSTTVALAEQTRSRKRIRFIRVGGRGGVRKGRRVSFYWPSGHGQGDDSAVEVFGNYGYVLTDSHPDGLPHVQCRLYRVRLSTPWVMDRRFGKNGAVSISAGDKYTDAECDDVAQLPSGALAVSGNEWSEYDSTVEFVAKFSSRGRALRFRDGRKYALSAPGNDYAGPIVADPYGGVFVVGSRTINSANVGGVAAQVTSSGAWSFPTPEGLIPGTDKTWTPSLDVDGREAVAVYANQVDVANGRSRLVKFSLSP